MADLPSNPTVRAFVAAINAEDRKGFFALLSPEASMSDDGSERDLSSWVDKEIFTVGGQMAVESESDGGLSLIARFTNSTWGTMRTRWHFTIDGGLVTRFDTGQA
jgi:hypothetical protein